MPIRVGGMATGMDTDMLVKQLMQAKRIPIDKMKQQKQQMEWQRDSYREMNTLLSQVRDAADKIRFSTGISIKKATSSNSNIATATANQNAMAGTYTLNVVQAAEYAKVQTNNTRAATDVVTTSATQIKVNDISINVAANATITDVVTAINAKTSDTNVKAFYDAGLQKITFTSTKMGDAARVDIESANTADAVANGLLTNMGFSSTATTDNQDFGKDTVVTLGSDPTEIRSATSTVTASNITFTVKSGPGTVTMTVEQDVDKTFENIKSLVDTYNSVIDKVHAKLGEQKYRDFLPLTEEQRSEMKDSEIEMWEKKAKSGMIRNDATLKGALDKFRTTLTNPMTTVGANEYNSLYDIGITTKGSSDAKATYLDKGKLYIDDSKLKAAIAENPDQVVNLFTNPGTTVDDPSTTKVREDIMSTSNDVGIAERLYRAVNNTISSLSKLAGNPSDTSDVSTIGLKMRDYDRRINESTSRLADYEQRYYSQFARLESMISKMQAQQSWLAGQMGGGQ